jgi:hypothetical protein
MLNPSSNASLSAENRFPLFRTMREIRHGPNTARLKEVPGDWALSTGEMPYPQPRRRRMRCLKN